MLEPDKLYDPQPDAKKSTEQLQKKYAEVIKVLAAGGKHRLFTLMSRKKAKSNDTVTHIVDVDVRFNGRNGWALCGFNEKAFEFIDETPRYPIWLATQHSHRSTLLGSKEDGCYIRPRRPRSLP